MPPFYILYILTAGSFLIGHLTPSSFRSLLPVQLLSLPTLHLRPVWPTQELHRTPIGTMSGAGEEQTPTAGVGRTICQSCRAAFSALESAQPAVQ